MDGGAWWATVHGVAKSRTQLSDFTFQSPSLGQLVSWAGPSIRLQTVSQDSGPSSDLDFSLSLDGSSLDPHIPS